MGCDMRQAIVVGAISLAFAVSACDIAKTQTRKDDAPQPAEAAAPESPKIESAFLAVKEPQLPQANLSDTTKKPLSVNVVTIDSAFAEKGWFENVGDPPGGGVGYGSNTPQGDKAKGIVALAFAPPANAAAIAVPVVTGPSGTNVVFRILVGETNMELANLTDPTGLATWRLWRVNLPDDAKGKSLRLVVEDKGDA